jgi:hypothetical protein
MGFLARSGDRILSGLHLGVNGVYPNLKFLGGRGNIEGRRQSRYAILMRPLAD